MSRLAIEIVAAIIFITATVLFLEHRGAEKCIAADQAAVEKQDIANAEIHGQQTVEVKHEAEDYHEAIAQPVVAAPVIRVCPRASSVPATSPAGSVDHDEASLREPNQEVPPAIEWNSEPVVRAGRDADAQIVELEKYITDVCFAPAK